MRICQNCNESFDETFGACPYCATTNPNQIDESQHTTTPETVSVQGEYDDNFDTPETAAAHEPEESINSAQTAPPNKPQKTGKIIILAILILAIIIGLLFGLGIVNVSDGKVHFGNDESYPTPTSPDGTPVIVGTNPDGVPVGPDGLPVEVETYPNGEIATNPDGSPIIIPNSSSASQGENSNTQSSSSQNSSSKNNNSSNNNSSSSSSSNTSKPSKKTVSINGNNFNVGDTITVNVYFKEPKATFLAISGTIDYNSKALSYVDKSVKFPNLIGAIANPKLENQIIFNSAMLEPYDFSTEKLLISASFIIQDSASASEDFAFSVKQILRESSTIDEYIDVPESDYSYRIVVE